MENITYRKQNGTQVTRTVTVREQKSGKTGQSYLVVADHSRNDYRNILVSSIVQRVPTTAVLPLA